MPYRSNTDILKGPTTWVTGTFSPSSEPGKVIWTEAAGVLSVQPDGSLEHRAAGTDGAYERAVQSGTRLVYDVGTPVVFSVIT